MSTQQELPSFECRVDEVVAHGELSAIDRDSGNSSDSDVIVMVDPATPLPRPALELYRQDGRETFRGKRGQFAMLLSRLDPDTLAMLQHVPDLPRTHEGKIPLVEGQR